jgi:4,5-DOPA dioxygenase extradiol
MPAVFIGHGNPMNALERNRYTESWRALGQVLPRPRAILVVSAHWYIQATAVTAMPRPRTIHDFFGFPDELFALDYPAAGDRAVAEEVADVVSPTWVGLDEDSWGLDHGTWSVLAHLFPEADVPVVQMSVNALQGLDHHLRLGAALAPLRERGVLVVGSGNIVHNLAGMDPRRTDEGFDWAHRFDDAARELMTGAPGDAPRLREAQDYDAAVPTPDHFLPLLYLAGLAGAAGTPTDVLVDGYAYGSLSMTSYTLDAPALPAAPETDAGAPPPPAEAAGPSSLM